MAEVDTGRLSELVGRRPCRELVAVAGDRACHVVGGAVRDCLLGRSYRDLDLLVDGEGERIARALADRLGGRLVDLGGEAFGSWRIVLETGDVDLWDRAGAPLRQELARRDLTINALAVELPAGRLRDPLHGLEDLQAGVLRCPRRESLQEDPLRVLRLVRLRDELEGFAPTAETVAAARDAAPELERVAGERIRDEWSRMRRTADPAGVVTMLCEVDLYPRLWAASEDADEVHDPTAADATARDAQRSAAHLREAAGELSGAVPGALPTPDAGAALDALLLAALPGPLSAVARLARRRHRSRAETTRLRRLLSWSRAPACDAACRRFLHQLGTDASTGLLWLGARALAADRGRPWARAVTRVAELEAASGEEIRNPPTLLAGDVLGKATGLAGKMLGRALDAIREAQVLGTVHTREEALHLVRRLQELAVWDDAGPGKASPRHED